MYIFVTCSLLSEVDELDHFVQLWQSVVARESFGFQNLKRLVGTTNRVKRLELHSETS